MPETIINVSKGTATTAARVIARSGVYVDGVDFNATRVRIDTNVVPVSFLTALAECKGVTANQRSVIKAAIKRHTSVDFDKPIVDLDDLKHRIEGLQSNSQPRLYVKVLGRTVPIAITDLYVIDAFYGKFMSFRASYRVVDVEMHPRVLVAPDDLHLVGSKKGTLTLRELLRKHNVFELTDADMAAYVKRQNASMAKSAMFGKLCDVTKPVLKESMTFFTSTLVETSLGMPGKPRQVIIEPIMESNTDDDASNTKLPPAAIVRCFSLDMKKYIYVDVDDLEEHVYDVRGHERIVLPEEMRSVLNSVFNTTAVFGDLFRGRHGGMVILANGPSGVGKTLTAEVFAEHVKRPLYVLEMGELGTNLEDVEKNLNTIFERAARWNAVLLFDEADVFLSKRSEHELERSAIVGVFLRLLDRYEGMFFLTTNRAEVIDDAFKSRITLQLNYPELSHDARAQILEQMLTSAGFDFDFDPVDVALSMVINGRQIRNVVRLLRAIKPNASFVTADDVLHAVKFTAKC